MYNICITIRVTRVVQRRCINYNIMYTRATRFGCVKTGTDFLLAEISSPEIGSYYSTLPPLCTRITMSLCDPLTPIMGTWATWSELWSHTCTTITPVINKILKKNQFIIAFLERSPIDR